MNYQTTIPDDPIAPELLRSRLEAIGQEAGAAVQQTAISPIVTESKDYSVTILDADGSIISATGLIEIHFGAVMNAVRTTIEVHGDTIAEGDVFIANDPHNGGGLHPQDIVIQRPVFVDGQRVAWVALAAVGGFLGFPEPLGKLIGWEHSNTFQTWLAPVLPVRTNSQQALGNVDPFGQHVLHVDLVAHQRHAFLHYLAVRPVAP